VLFLGEKFIGDAEMIDEMNEDGTLPEKLKGK